MENCQKMSVYFEKRVVTAWVSPLQRHVRCFLLLNRGFSRRFAQRLKMQPVFAILFA